ncbi:MAG TPA: hypothetical protein VF884_09715 [Nitrososphaeraceae archaeon]
MKRLNEVFTIFSVGARMVAEGNNVYISRIDIGNGQEQVLFRASSNNVQTFGKQITASSNSKETQSQ